MSSAATPADFFKVPDDAEEWVALGQATLRFNTLTLSGFHAAGEANTGNVRFRPLNGDGYVIIPPEGEYKVTAPEGSFFRADQFELYSESDGDGLYGIYGQAVVYEGP